MSNCKNKFLGLDSIDVLMQYINTKVSEHADAKICTLQVYKYVLNGETPDYPSNNIYYNYEAKYISFPVNNTGWNTLNNVLSNLSEDSLEYGSIYTSIRLQIDETSADYKPETQWSKPIKISGINGRNGAEFRYSYDQNADPEKSSKLPIIATEENPIVWFWAKSENGNWSGPEKWNVFTRNGVDGTNGRQILYRYCGTSRNNVTDGIPNPPAPPKGGNDPKWSNTLLNINLSEETPYLWMSTAIVVAGETIEESEANGTFTGWSDPILFSKLGLDGNVPDYTVTIYAKGAEEDGLIQPDAPEFEEGQTIDYYKNESWLDVPSDETGYWWQRTLKLSGIDNTVLEAGALKRYNGVNGESQPGEWSEMCFMWSETQQKPALEIIEGATYPAGWDSQYPNAQPSVGANLWMTVGTFKGMNENGTPKLITPWSDPVCISGPICPVSLDSRFEIRYTNGNATTINPQGTWVDDPSNVNVTNTYPYIWGKQYLVYYKVNYEYETDQEGNFNITETSANVVPDGVTQEYAPYRISGLNGNNGNTKNKIMYNVAEMDVEINSFTNENMYVYNGVSGITYTLNYNQIDFETGFTGKFSNIGKGIVTIKAVEPYAFVGSGKTNSDDIRTITINSQETVELICYKAESEKSFIVIGKEI